MERGREAEQSPLRFGEMERLRYVRPRTAKVQINDVVKLMRGHFNKEDKSRLAEVYSRGQMLVS